MPRVLTICPRTDEAVFTCLRMQAAQLAALTETRLFRCAGCGEVHEWFRSEAWVEQDPAELARLT